jgi:hypothetical protein
MSTGARRSGQALLTGGELTISRKALAAALQAVSISRRSFGRRRQRHGHKGKRYQHWNDAPHVNLLLVGGEYTRGVRTLPLVKALTGRGLFIDATGRELYLQFSLARRQVLSKHLAISHLDAA